MNPINNTQVSVSQVNNPAAERATVFITQLFQEVGLLEGYLTNRTAEGDDLLSLCQSPEKAEMRRMIEEASKARPPGS